MACDLPVVATNNRGHVEYVAHDQNGFLVDVNDSASLAEYVLRLHDDVDLRRRITEHAQNDIEKYGTEAAMKELVEMVLRHA